MRNDLGSPGAGGVGIPRPGPGEGEGEDDVALVDVNTAATASVMSPNVWIRRPRKAVPMRSPDGTSRGGVYDDENMRPPKTSSRVKSRTTPMRRGHQDGVGELTRHAGMIEREHAVADHGDHVPGSSKRTPGGVQVQEGGGVNHGTRRRRRKSAVFQSDEYIVEETASPEADPGLYVSIQQDPDAGVVRRMVSPGGQDDDILKTVEENDKAEADLKEISDIEGEIAKNAEVNMLLEQLLASKTKKLEELHVQNATIKRIFGAVDVVKDDFIIEGLLEEERRNKMIRIGQRLIQSLRGASAKAGHPSASGRDGQATAAAAEDQGHSRHACLPMAAPDMYPMESQIAAASVIAAKGDPARALLSLLEKALEANMLDRHGSS